MRLTGPIQMCAAGLGDAIACAGAAGGASRRRRLNHDGGDGYQPDAGRGRGRNLGSAASGDSMRSADSGAETAMTEPPTAAPAHHGYVVVKRAIDLVLGTLVLV